MKSCRVIVCLLLAILLTHTQWAMLQGVAFTSMLVRYSAQAGVAEGLRDTFDGQHPCDMCCAIKAARAQEKAQETSLTLPVRDSVMLMAAASPDRMSLSTPPVLTIINTDPITPNGRRDQPPIPPPP